MEQLKTDKIFIDGEWTTPESGRTTDLISPTTEQSYASVVSASKGDMDRAVESARHAFNHGSWPQTSLEERLEILRRLRTLLEENSERIARIITQQMGSPISQSRSIQVANAVRAIDSYLDFVPSYPFRTLRRSSTTNALVTREAAGVVAAVSPWNMPLAINVQKVVPALVMGCTMVLKPSSETPLDAYLLADLLSEAGLPPGVINVVAANRDSSSYLVSHEDVDKVTFTGSTAAGRSIASRCGKDLRRATLELGGKSAAILLEDADLDHAVESMRLGSFRNSGQICSLKTRILVHESQKTEVLERLVSLVRSMPVSDPMDEATQIGPLVSERQRKTVEGYIESGKSEGARCVIGGGRPPGLDRGWYIEPTVFADATPNMTVAREEIFGPVVSVLTYKDEKEAIALANDSVYGLNGSVFTQDIERGLRVAGRMQTGTVELNGNPSGYYAPMGGVKTSGIGRENGPEGLEAYSQLKSIGVSPDVADQLAPQESIEQYS